MDHVAILEKNGGWLEKILSGDKSIESRWYKTRKAPYGKISPGDIIYLKKSGMSVIAKAEVERVAVFNNLNEKSVKYIIKNYAEAIGIPKKYDSGYLNYNYAILIFLKSPQTIKSFDVDKTGYGIGSAWLTVEDINDIKIK